MNYVNLTLHPIDIQRIDGSIMHIEPTAPAARCDEVRLEQDIFDGFRVSHPVYGEVINLPPTVENTIYIVSKMVLDAAVWRTDLVAPGPAIRDAKGNIIAADGFTI